MHTLLIIVTALPGLLTGAGILYCGLALWAMRDFRAQRNPPRNPQPGTRPEHPEPPSISILKAVKGLDPGLAEALRTHCTQDYPTPFELLFAVHSLSDPSVPTLHALAQEFPHLRIEVIATPLTLGTNGKISNLAQLLPHARHELILVSDADIAVAPGYLRRITTPFAGPFEGRETGLVTTPYFGRTHPLGSPTLGSRLEALTLSTDFIPGVLTARYTERGMHFALGATLLVSRPALAAAGGLEGLTGVLADDHALGQRVAAAGYRVVLSNEAVSTSVPAYTLPEFWRHQLRWARTVRDARPGGYLGLVFTQPVPWAVLYVFATGCSLFSIVLLLCAILARMAVSVSIGFGLLRDVQVLRDIAFLALRDCIGLALWTWSYAGNIVEWRGERFRVHHGKLLRISRRGHAAGADLQ